MGYSPHALMGPEIQEETAFPVRSSMALVQCPFFAGKKEFLIGE
jgi:hypothetical protein